MICPYPKKKQPHAKSVVWTVIPPAILAIEEEAYIKIANEYAIFDLDLKAKGYEQRPPDYLSPKE
ncbi:hypothetical protein CEXT_619451, partial [Caerostris extrusa]